MWKSDNEEENKIIINKYRQILRHSNVEDPEKRKQIRKAFTFALEAHKEMRRRSGEPYILHPLEVALIQQKKLGFNLLQLLQHYSMMWLKTLITISKI